MKKYIIVNLVGAANDKITLFLETSDNFKIKEIVRKAGFGDYKILDDWRIVVGAVIK